MSKQSDYDRSRSSRSRPTSKVNISVDNLFPSDARSGARGNRFDVETLFKNTPLNNEPEITFTADVLLERINRRRFEKLKCFRQMLNYCHKKISETDSNNGTDIVVSIVESFPECKDYTPQECLEYISTKLREEDIDALILNDTTIFISWYNLELKRETKEEKEKNVEEPIENNN